MSRNTWNHDRYLTNITLFHNYVKPGILDEQHAPAIMVERHPAMTLMKASNLRDNYNSSHAKSKAQALRDLSQNDASGKAHPYAADVLAMITAEAARIESTTAFKRATGAGHSDEEEEQAPVAGEGVDQSAVAEGRGSSALGAAEDGEVLGQDTPGAHGPEPAGDGGDDQDGEASNKQQGAEGGGQHPGDEDIDHSTKPRLDMIHFKDCQ
ncbi:hypothetical protein CLAFUW4_10737 [Fulvia fulva]|uniref:Uncharacterized protein n=1 Tax=Passalora fulva TaxID=5499 RepID=A0A9Q8LEQ5_PASFU|nr:uncharacterized protein CLAFUR5_05350 [Fulvia fulva]KAK4615950.1 hypothetical protein CLAFUR4_10742 [Fulvia fulva]KAK4617058.1 hypothetical protein CLAFUR0_10749 [Fulvia fulva]UJO16045.1 hypothetical protein CLAFUR5_05350 [Fulvia fulva]WPV19384.1 hypothetical protein CLAFUW4_10737 [Fulvia fulva]WPV34370.1 hypothetical protein CLAFUW7_10739 [Fulvia fulva]